MTILEVGIEKDDPQLMSEGKTEAVVDQNQDQGLLQKPTQIEIALDALNVQSMIFCWQSPKCGHR